MRKSGRSLFIVVPLALVFLASAASVSADTGINHDGNYGIHYLADSEEYPGVRCHYDSSTEIDAVRVRDPFVFARDRVSGSVDSQRVAWHYRVQARTPSTGDWATVATSAVQKRMATDAQVANFSPMTTSFNGTPAKEYRVVVVMRWYRQDGTTVAGRATHRADWYSWVGVPSFEGLCPGGIF
jgi:hypothetical protein